MTVSRQGDNPQVAYDGEVSTAPESRFADVPPREHGMPSATGEETDLELVLAFLNTCDAEAGTELLEDLPGWRRWCAERGWVDAPDARAAQEVRDLMRTSVTCGTVPPSPSGATARWPVRIELRAGVPVTAGEDAVGGVLVAAARLVSAGHWERVKICPAEDCRWAFYDRSRNRSRTWCSMRVCGNRNKARSWRERHTES